MTNHKQHPISDVENSSTPHCADVENAGNDSMYAMSWWSSTFKMKSTQEDFDKYFLKEKRQNLLRWCLFILCLDIPIFCLEFMHSLTMNIWRYVELLYLIISIVSAVITVVMLLCRTTNVNFLAQTNFCWIAVGAPVVTLAFMAWPKAPIMFILWFYILWYGVFVGFSLILHINFALVSLATVSFFLSVGYTTLMRNEVPVTSDFTGQVVFLAILCILTTNEIVFSTSRLNLKLFITFQVLKKNKEQELDRLYVLKKQYISQTLHDIGTPLTTLQLGQEILEQSDLPEEAKEIVLTNKSAIEMMILTRKKALDFAKFDQTGMLIPTISEVNIREILHSKCSRIMTGFNSSPDVILRFWVAENISTMIYSDGDWLWEMLCNLLSNALKFTTDGFVEAKTSLSGNLLLFEVRDTGKGVSEEGKMKLFRPFSQLQCDAGGTGLGLYSVYCRAKALGGNVGVRDNTEEGIGSVFYFTIPYKPVSPQVQSCSESVDLCSENKQTQNMWVGEQKAEKESDKALQTSDNVFLESKSHKHSLAMTHLFQSSCNHESEINLPQKKILTLKTENRSSKLFRNLQQAVKVVPEYTRNRGDLYLGSLTPLVTEKKCILLIEDEKSIAKFMVHMLEKAGLKVDHVPNGKIGLEQLKNSDGCYHVVLCDLLMPVMSGFEMVELFRQWENDRSQRENAPLKNVQVIIALSASQSQEEQERAIHCGFTSFVSKPVKITQLLQEIETAVRNNNPMPSN